MDDEQTIRTKLERAGTALSDSEWDALPEAAQRRLQEHPAQSKHERTRLAALVRWLLWEFPPGWSRLDR